MREIKFRAWDVWEQTWLNEERCWQELENISRWNPEVGEIFKISQYTGLKDKNGKEIYEGDILIWEINGKEIKASVIFDVGAFWMDKDENGYSVCNDWYRGEYKIIGNIYENSELIK